MKRMIILCMVLFVSSFLFSYEYIMNTNPLAIGSYQGTVQITTLSGGDWDDGYYDLAIPAANQFYYYGKLVTHLRISTNGHVVLGFGSAPIGGTHWSNYSIPYPGGEENFVAPLWDDLDLTSMGALYYQIVQNADKNNYISVEWRGVPHISTSTAYSFSCVFLSSDNCFLPNTIIFAYADVDSGSSTFDNGKDATVGIENSTGTVGEQYSYNEAIVTNGLRITFTPFMPVYGSTTDYYDPNSHDYYPEAVVFRPSNGTWYFHYSDGITRNIQFGTKGDVAVPGDYDGDSCVDECVFRPSNCTWYCNAPNFIIQWGTTGDIPVPADYNGDGQMDIAVFRPGSGNWYVYYRGSGTTYIFNWGTAGDIPLPAAYDGDNLADFAVYRPANNTWYIHRTSDGGAWIKTWGTAGDIPKPSWVYFSGGGSSYSILTVFRPGSGNWFSLNQSTGTTSIIQWGQDGDVPLLGFPEYAESINPAVFRPVNGSWFLSNPFSYPTSFQWGTLGDKPRYHTHTN